MEIFKSIVTNVLTALYQPFWFAVLLTIFILFFYMYPFVHCCKKSDIYVSRI